MPLTTPQESAHLVANAIRAGIAANPSQASALRTVRGTHWPSAQDVTDDQQVASSYLRNTAPGSMEQVLVRESLSLLAPIVNQMTDAGVTSLRDRLRALMVSAQSPQWLKEDAERAKRSMRIHVVSPTERVPDRQDTDPSVVAAEAALLVLAAANSTREQIGAAAQAIEHWRQMTPHAPDPASRLTPP